MNFQTINFQTLGLPPVGLGKGHNILVGEPRRKTVTFFTLAFPILGQITLQKKKKKKKLTSFSLPDLAILPEFSNAQKGTVLSSFPCQ